MNLNAIVAPAVRIVNPAIDGQLLRSTGYTISADGTQVPGYASATAIVLDVQPMSGGARRALEHIDGLNLQGVFHEVWAYGDIKGVDMAVGYGGDLLTFSGSTWLVITVIEAWNGIWTNVAVQKQSTP